MDEWMEHERNKNPPVMSRICCTVRGRISESTRTSISIRPPSLLWSTAFATSVGRPKGSSANSASRVVILKFLARNSHSLFVLSVSKVLDEWGNASKVCGHSYSCTSSPSFSGSWSKIFGAHPKDPLAYSTSSENFSIILWSLCKISMNGSRTPE